MFWGGQPGHPPARPCGASCGAEPTHSSVPVVGGGRARAIAQPVALSTPCSHPPAVRLPAPRGLASLAEGGAAAGGSRCHLHLAALGTGGGSSSALPRAVGIPRGLVAEGWGVAGSPGDALWEKPLQPPQPAGTSCPHTRHTHGRGLGSTWHHTVGGDRTHGNGRQHRLREETQHVQELHKGTGEFKGELGPC